MLALAAPAFGGTIAVDTTVDGLVDDGHCGLREAVAAANGDVQPSATPGECVAGSGADTITIPAGSYAMNAPSQPLSMR